MKKSPEPARSANADKRCAQSVKRALKDCREWMGINWSENTESARSRFEKYLLESPMTALRLVPLGLKQFAISYANRGVVNLLDQKSDGWNDIDKSYLYRLWITRITATIYFKDLADGHGTRGIDLHIPPAACVLAFSLVHRLNEWEQEMTRLFVRAATTRGAFGEPFWSQRIFEPFMLRLQQKLHGEPLPRDIEERDLGPYSKILEHWEGDQLTADDIIGVCDYHCRNMQDRGGDWMEEFRNAPFDVYPVDILAIYAVRDQLGLPTPNVEHPLMTTPLANRARREVNVEPDEIIARVATIYHECYGDGQPPVATH